MATLAFTKRASIDREHRFFIRSAIVMTLTVFAGFSLQLAMGRSSFAVPIFLHVHAFFFFGWTVLYLVQNVRLVLNVSPCIGAWAGCPSSGYRAC